MLLDDRQWERKYPHSVNGQPFDNDSGKFQSFDEGQDERRLNSPCKAHDIHYLRPDLLMNGNLQRDPLINLVNQAIIKSKTIRFLGMQLDEELNFYAHTETNMMLQIASQYKIPLSCARLYENVVLSVLYVMAHQTLEIKKLE